MLNYITQILLLLTLALNIILSVYMVFNTHMQYKNDKKFYKKLCKDLESQRAVFLNHEEGIVCDDAKENANKK